MQHNDPIGIWHLIAQMRSPQHRYRALLAHRQNELDQVAAACRIEANRRLVHQQNARLMQQGASQLNPSPIAATQLRCLVMSAFGQVQSRQFFFDTPLCYVTREAMQTGMEKQIAGHRQFEI